MKNLGKKLTLSFLMIAPLLAFQNCAKIGFATDSTGLNQKLNEDGSQSSATDSVVVDDTVKSEIDLQCGDVDRNIQWILRDAFVAGKAVTVPGDYKFVFKIQKQELSKTKVCAGDCGRAYKLGLHSFSGPIDIEYTCRFDEAKAIFTNKIYSTFDAVEAATHGGTDLFHELDRTFAGALRGEFIADASKDRKEMKLTFVNGDFLIFVVR